MRTDDPVKLIDRAFDEMKTHRLAREGEWQQIADHYLPRKDFSLAPRAGDLRRRRLTSSVPATALRNSAAMLVSNLIDPTNPFIAPNVENSLVAAGRTTRLDGRATDFLYNMGWGIHGRMMRPKSGFLTGAARLAIELWAFGTGIMWIGHKRGFGPIYHTRPLRSCWIACGEEGVVDTLYYEFSWPLWRVLKRFENAKLVDGWDTADEGKLRAPVTILHAVEPRRGKTTRGGDRRNKPFSERFVCLEKKALLEEGGYDTFPFAVPRLEPEEGSDYGTGRCWYSLPDAIALSVLQQGVEVGVDLKVTPPMLAPKRLFAKPLDRRPGAMNYYDPAQLGFQDARNAVQQLGLAGDVGLGAQYLERLVQSHDSALLVDWMKLRDSGNVTAEEIRERRNLRVQVMNAHVPGIDRDWMGVVAERTADVMLAEGDLGEVPASLAGAEVEWDYAGPLARAQMQRQAEGFGRVFDAALRAKDLDPAAPYVLNIMEGLRAVAEAEGLPVGVLRAREEVDALVEADREKAADVEELQGVQMGAGALRDGAQGLASLANMGAEAPQAMAA